MACRHRCREFSLKKCLTVLFIAATLSLLILSHSLTKDHKKISRHVDPPQLSALRGEKSDDHPKATTTIVKVTTTQRPQTPVQKIKGSSKKYIIYVCDNKRYCYGFGDRQRAIVGVYFLAEVTNRTFGLIMTSPTNYTTFYRPNLVNWDIPKSELEGKTSVEIEALGPKVNLKLDTIIFDNAYPQDVVYIRTNQKLQNSLLKNKFYQSRFPKWTPRDPWRIFQAGWMRLMAPTDFLRQRLNDELARIAQAMLDEYRVWKTLAKSDCCIRSSAMDKACTNSTCIEVMNRTCCTGKRTNTRNPLPKQCENWNCSAVNKSASYCREKCTGDDSATRNCSSSSCPESLNNTSPSIAQKCVAYLENKVEQGSEFSRLKRFAGNFCSIPHPRLKPNITVQQIRKLRGHDTVDLNLVCVHVRLGHSSSLPFEMNVRNKASTVNSVWDFLRPYVAKGHHVYLASDADEIRKEGKRVFGDRLHVTSDDIVHIATVRKGQDKVEGTRTALMEQLLLATSCKVLVVSYSGYSMRAANIRDILQGGTLYGTLYLYKNGQVKPKGLKYLP